MKKILKVLSLVLALVMCFTMVFTTAVSAEETTTPTLTIVGQTVEAGAETATINVVASDFTTIAGAHFVVELGSLTDVVVDNEYADYDEATNAVSFVKEAEWDNGECLGFADGTILTITVAAPAEAGSYEVAFGATGKDVDFCTAALEEVAVELVAGAVVVEESEPECDHAAATKVFKEKTENAFVYTYTCECGATGEFTYEIGADFDGTVGTKKTINPTNDIAMTFRFESAPIADYTDLVVVITKEVYAKAATDSTTEEQYVVEYDTKTTGYYSFKFADVAAYEMNNKITAELYGLKDGVISKLGAVADYRVKDYISTTLTTYATSTNASIVKLRTALVDLLNYGAKAQVLGNFNVANLVNADLTEAQIAWGTPESEYCGANTVWSTLPTAAGALEGSNDTNKVTVTKTLNPAEKVYLQFTLKSHAADINSYSVVFDYYDTKGNAQTTEMLSFAEAGFTKSNGNQGFEFSLAPITTFDYPVTATFYCDGVAVYEEVYSIEAYIKSTYTYADNSVVAYQNIGNFVKAMYAYGRSMAAAANVAPYAN